MAIKTGSCWALPLLLLSPPLLAGQSSPLQWPVPSAPRRAVAAPRLLLDAGELAGLLKSGRAVPLDVQGPYEQGHVPGAVPAWGPDEDGGGDALRVRSLLAARGLTGDEAVVLYGADREAVARLFWLLRAAGYAEVRILDGGLDAWRVAGGRIEQGPSRRPAAEEGPRRLSLPGTAAVDVAWLDDSFGQPGIEVLDVRDAEGWERFEVPAPFAAGHIPHSLPFDPRALLAGPGGWPAAEEVRRRLGTLGPRPGDPVSLDATFVLYAEDARDPRLGLGYLLLTLAGLDVRVFPGGWREWTAGGGRPTVRVISAAELAARLRSEHPDLNRDLPPRGLILFDLREEGDFAIGHLAGARVFPFDRFSDGFRKMLEAGWPVADRTTLPLVLYCYGPECIRSRDAGAQAARLGFRTVLWFRGGVREWRDAGYPLLDSPPPKAAEPPAPLGAEASRP